MALKQACETGIYIGGITAVTHIVSQQLIKLGADRTIRASGTFLVNKLGSKNSALIAKAAGYEVSGAAAKNVASKIIRGHIVIGAVTVVVMSSADIARMFQGKISGRQLFKNVANTTASVAGGTAGWLGGAALGVKYGSIVPGWGNIIGGVIGGIAGGMISSFGASKVLDYFIEDDADEMLDILQDRVAFYAHEHLLVESEVTRIVDFLSENQSATVGLLQRMFESSDRQGVADEFLLPFIDGLLLERKIISTSTNKPYIYLKNKTIKVAKSLMLKITSSRFYLKDGIVKKKILYPVAKKVERLQYYQTFPKVKSYNNAVIEYFEEALEESLKDERFSRISHSRKVH